MYRALRHLNPPDFRFPRLSALSKPELEQPNMLIARGITGGLAVCGVTFRLDGLPEGQDMVETCGLGGGPPAKIVSGPLEGWSVGSGERSEVFGR